MLKSDGQHLTLLAPAHNGIVYMIHGVTGCTFKVDIGENAYGMILVDDVTGNGKLDLIITTMNGNVICLGTDVNHETPATWTSRENGLPGSIQRSDALSVTLSLSGSIVNGEVSGRYVASVYDSTRVVTFPFSQGVPAVDRHKRSSTHE